MATEYRPDCGFAWIVVAACFAINFIMAGLTRAAGVLYVSLIDTYGVSREVATTPFSLRFCVRNLTGPAVGALGQRFGIRPVVLLGGLICGLGGILSALAPDVTWITVAWGGIHGIGYGMCNLIHVIVINRYFHKYKGLALGISLTGDCIGTFLLPLVLELLLSSYDLRGTFLILAGISLNVVPASMLLKSPAWEKSDRTSSWSLRKYAAPAKYKSNEQSMTNEGFEMQEDCDIKLGINSNHPALPKITINGQNENQMCSESEEILNDKVEEICTEQTRNNKLGYMQFMDFCYRDRNKGAVRNNSFLNDIYSLRESTSLRLTDTKLSKKKLRYDINSLNKKNRRMSVSSILSCPPQVEKFALDSLRKSSLNILIPYPCTCLESPKNMQDLPCQTETFCFQHGRILHIENKTLSTTMNSSTPDNELQSRLNMSIMCVPSIELNTGLRNEKVDDNTSQVSKRNFLLNFLKTNIKPIFLVISATMAFYCFMFISVFTIIIDYGSDNGIPSDYGKYLIIAFSVTDVFGRIGFGIVLDKKWIALNHFAGLTVGLMGFFILIIPFYKCFIFWTISFSLCGLIQGGVSIMFPMLVDNYMDKNEETVALGCLNFYAGILMLPIPPMIGYFRDNIGSYDGVFWTVGTFCIFAASLWSLEACLVPKQQKPLEKPNYIEHIKNNNGDV